MAEFVLSAFADEYSPIFDEQINGLIENNIKYMEIRGVDGKNISDIKCDEAKILNEKLKANGLSVSSIGSPIGKIKLDDPFPQHLEKLKHVIELAHIFDTKRIRLFSFYIPAGRSADDCRGEVLYKMEKMLETANAMDAVICHENERDIYGDTDVRCLDIQKYFRGDIKCIFDHANFICCDVEPYPQAYNLLCDYIYYLHIKDSSKDKQMMPAGEGIGKIPQTIEALKKYDKTFILTIEPHLQVFRGIDNLQKQDGEGKVINQYATSAQAFRAAADAVKRYI